MWSIYEIIQKLAQAPLTGLYSPVAPLRAQLKTVYYIHIIEIPTNKGANSYKLKISKIENYLHSLSCELCLFLNFLDIVNSQTDLYRAHREGIRLANMVKMINIFLFVTKQEVYSQGFWYHYSLRVMSSI